MRRTPLAPLDIPATEWNRIQEPSNTTGIADSRRIVQPDYVRAVGQNKSGATLAPGSPVYYTAFTADSVPTVFSPKQPGYWELRHCYWPHVSTDRTDFVTRGFRYQMIGIVLDSIENDAVGGFAISGVCAVKITGTGNFARPTIKPNSFESQMTASTRWGFPILARYGDWAWIDLARLERWFLIGVTRTGGLSAGAEVLVSVPEGATAAADFPAFTTGSSIPANTTIGLWPTETQWCAMRIC